MVSATRPENVGIIAMETYFPSYYVKQAELEKDAGIKAGKYTIGLGQDKMAFVTDREDIYSVSLSVTQRLLDNFGIKPEQIGRLEVATETITDHSKAVKTYLMQLFGDNSDIEGVDSMNACYAGTNALFNSLAWVESSDWDGRYALVVTGDIAEYSPGPARPTGGCGAVAFLIGPDAPIVLEQGCRSSHMEHAYDFYKPNLDSPYPVVDGKFSNSCYLKATDICYQRYCSKFAKTYGSEFNLDSADYAVYHAPYNKLVQKSFARMKYNDFLRNPDCDEFAGLAKFAQVEKEASYTDRALDKAFQKVAKSEYASKVAPGTLLPKQLGNLYTASVYAGLLSLISDKGRELQGKRILMFSYGSGLCSSLFSFRVRTTAHAGNQLAAIGRICNLDSRLAKRTEQPPKFFNDCLNHRAELHKVNAFEPKGDVQSIAPGAFFLTKKDNAGRRFHTQVQIRTLAKL